MYVKKVDLCQNWRTIAVAVHLGKINDEIAGSLEFARDKIRGEMLPKVNAKQPREINGDFRQLSN